MKKGVKKLWVVCTEAALTCNALANRTSKQMSFANFVDDRTNTRDTNSGFPVSSTAMRGVQNTGGKSGMLVSGTSVSGNDIFFVCLRK